MISEYNWASINIQIYTLTTNINSRLPTKYHKGLLRSNMNRKGENTKLKSLECNGNGYIDKPKVHDSQDLFLRQH